MKTLPLLLELNELSNKASRIIQELHENNCADKVLMELFHLESKAKLNGIEADSQYRQFNIIANMAIELYVKKDKTETKGEWKPLKRS